MICCFTGTNLVVFKGPVTGVGCPMVGITFDPSSDLKITIKDQDSESDLNGFTNLHILSEIFEMVDSPTDFCTSCKIGYTDGSNQNPPYFAINL